MSTMGERELERALRATAPAVEAGDLVPGLVARAEREGLLELAYATVESPFGDLLVARTEHGIVNIALHPDRPELVLEELASSVSPRILEAPARLDEVRRELDSYFEGRLHRFTVPLDWRLVHGFQTGVLRATARIPYGQTRSYGEIAEQAGNARASRAAGTALGRNPLPLLVPCHRVLRSGGVVGNYGGGPEMKRALLELEGAL
jgi:methylated-DNA-[protein]-cysteine S-methyltransferase